MEPDGICDRHQGSGQQAAFAQDLKAVTNTQDEPAVRREALDCLHHRGEASDSPAAQVVSVRKPARQYHGIDISQFLGIVPNKLCLMAEVLRHSVKSVVIAVASGEDDNADFHGKYHFTAPA